MEQWNGIVEWNTGISFNCIFVSLGYYFPALQIFLKDVVRIQGRIQKKRKGGGGGGGGAELGIDLTWCP